MNTYLAICASLLIASFGFSATSVGLDDERDQWSKWEVEVRDFFGLPIPEVRTPIYEWGSELKDVFADDHSIDELADHLKLLCANRLFLPVWKSLDDSVIVEFYFPREDYYEVATFIFVFDQSGRLQKVFGSEGFLFASGRFPLRELLKPVGSGASESR